MNDSNKESYIGFPPPLLGEQPIRLPVLLSGDGFFAIEKPYGIGSSAHPWWKNAPDMQNAIAVQAEAKKRELDVLGISEVKTVYPLEPEVNGIIIFTTNNDSASLWNNAFGSNQLEFTFQFISRNNETSNGSNDIVCDLPLVQHRENPVMVVSHHYGKKAFTHFRRLKTWRNYSLWEATTQHFRIHQVRAHANECAISVVGDSMYRGSQPILLSSLKKKYRGDKETERPMHDYPLIELLKIRDLRPDTGSMDVTLNPSRKFASVLKKLAEFNG